VPLNSYICDLATCSKVTTRYLPAHSRVAQVTRRGTWRRTVYMSGRGVRARSPSTTVREKKRRGGLTGHVNAVQCTAGTATGFHATARHRVTTNTRNNLEASPIQCNPAARWARQRNCSELQAGRSRARDPMRRINFFNLPNPSDHARPWGLLSL
jgi:hypothetical protein